MTPQNLSPMEAALLSSLQESSVAHEQRLSALESLLKQLGEQSENESATGNEALQLLQTRLDTLTMNLAALAKRLDALEPSIKKHGEIYDQATGAFRAMQQQYQSLAVEAKALRLEVTGLKKLADV